MISNRTRNVHDFRLSRHTILKLYGIIHKRKIYENQAKGGLWFLAILTGQEPPAPQSPLNIKDLHTLYTKCTRKRPKSHEIGRFLLP